MDMTKSIKKRSSELLPEERKSKMDNSAIHAKRSKFNLQKVILAGILVLVVMFFTLLNGRFISEPNIRFILIQNAFVMITGCAVTLLMISGHIDLSVGSTACLTGVVFAYFCRAGFSIGIALIFTLLIGLLIGLINAILVVKLKITPFIATLGTMYMGRGISYLTTNGLVIREGLPYSFDYLGNEYLGQFPIIVIVMLVIVVTFLILERKSVLGKYSIAIGGNKTAAILSGINSDAIVQLLYVLCSGLAAVSGILMASRLGVGDPNTAIGFEFDVIIAIILGGTSLAGGEGSIFGMLIGALIIGCVGNGMRLLNVFTFYQSVVKGIILVLAVVLYGHLKIRFKRTENLMAIQ
jgi:ribose/xylose/arabinose/galactoside ABC-type transport system permease subunit